MLIRVFTRLRLNRAKVWQAAAFANRVFGKRDRPATAPRTAGVSIRHWLWEFAERVAVASDPLSVVPLEFGEEVPMIHFPLFVRPDLLWT